MYVRALILAVVALCHACDAEDDFCLTESLESLEGEDISYSCDEADDRLVCTCVGGPLDGRTFEVPFACGFAQDDGRGDIREQAQDACIPFDDEE